MRWMTDGEMCASVFRVSLEDDRRFVLQAVIEDVQIARCQLCQQNISEVGIDVMLDAVEVPGKIGITPVVQSVMCDEFIHQLPDCYQLCLRRGGLQQQLLRRTQLSAGFVQLDLRNAEIRLFHGGETLTKRFRISRASVCDFVLMPSFSCLHFVLLSEPPTPPSRGISGVPIHTASIARRSRRDKHWFIR